MLLVRTCPHCHGMLVHLRMTTESWEIVKCNHCNKVLASVPENFALVNYENAILKG